MFRAWGALLAATWGAVALLGTGCREAEAPGLQVAAMKDLQPDASGSESSPGRGTPPLSGCGVKQPGALFRGAVLGAFSVALPARCVGGGRAAARHQRRRVAGWCADDAAAGAGRSGARVATARHQPPLRILSLARAGAGAGRQRLLGAGTSAGLSTAWPPPLQPSRRGSTSWPGLRARRWLRAAPAGRRARPRPRPGLRQRRRGSWSARGQPRRSGRGGKASQRRRRRRRRPRTQARALGRTCCAVRRAAGGRAPAGAAPVGGDAFSGTKGAPAGTTGAVVADGVDRPGVVRGRPLHLGAEAGQGQGARHAAGGGDAGAGVVCARRRKG